MKNVSLPQASSEEVVLPQRVLEAQEGVADHQPKASAPLVRGDRQARELLRQSEESARTGRRGPRPRVGQTACATCRIERRRHRLTVRNDHRHPRRRDGRGDDPHSG